MKTLFCSVSLAIVTACAGSIAAAQGLRLPGPFDPGLDTLRIESARPQWRAGSPLAPKGEFAYTTAPSAHEVAGGLYQPLSDRLSTLMETSYSSGSGLTQEWSMFGEVAAAIGEGWGVKAGLRHSELGLKELPLYTPSLAGSTSADIGMLTVERTWNRYRGAYTYYAGRSDAGTLASGHRVQVHYFYGERSSVGLAYTTAQQMDSLGSFGALPLAGTETSNVGVIGEHWLSSSWSVNYNALLEDAGSEGLKPELRLGLRLRF
jgi:YaiO family outer membrane protein